MRRGLLRVWPVDRHRLDKSSASAFRAVTCLAPIQECRFAPSAWRLFVLMNSGIPPPPPGWTGGGGQVAEMGIAIFMRPASQERMLERKVDSTSEITLPQGEIIFT